MYSSPHEHLPLYITQAFTPIYHTMPAPRDKQTRTNLEVFFIVVQKPSLNEPVKSNVLQHFRNDERRFLMILMTFYFIFC